MDGDKDASISPNSRLRRKKTISQMQVAEKRSIVSKIPCHPLPTRVSGSTPGYQNLNNHPFFSLNFV